MAPKNVTHGTKTHTMGLARPTPDPFTNANSIFIFIYYYYYFHSQSKSNVFGCMIFLCNFYMMQKES
jgi:hypothetical protein